MRDPKYPFCTLFVGLKVLTTAYTRQLTNAQEFGPPVYERKPPCAWTVAERTPQLLRPKLDALV